GAGISARITDQRPVRIGADASEEFLATPEQIGIRIGLELRRSHNMDAVVGDVRIIATQLGSHVAAPYEVVIEWRDNSPFAGQIVPAEDERAGRNSKAPRGQNCRQYQRRPLMRAKQYRGACLGKELLILPHFR